MDRKTLEKAITTLKNGGVLVFPTETVYGIGCGVFFQQSIRRVLKIKERKADKPLPVLISDTDQLTGLVKGSSAMVSSLIKTFWPGPLTIIFQAGEAVPEEVTAGTGTVGVRMPDHPLCLEILKQYGKPVVAPSANISGQEPPASFMKIEPAVIEEADMAMDDGVCRYGIPSTVVDATGRELVIVREGAITITELQTAVPAVIK